MLHLVTDSTSDLLPEEAAALGVTVVPLTVLWGEEQYRDGIDLGAAEFYRRLTTTAALPRTSQPSPEQFAAVYRELLRDSDDRVVSVHISPRWSGTLQSATLGAREVGEDRVVCVDSGSVSAGMQILVRAALRDRDAGCDAGEVARLLEERRARLGIFVLLDTLTYLQRGGRIGRAQALLGGVLQVRPILHLVDGVAHPAARVRGRQPGLVRMLELLREQGALEGAATMDSGAPELLEELRPRLQAAYPEVPLVSGHMGPVVGTYAGPGGIGVAYLRAR